MEKRAIGRCGGDGEKKGNEDCDVHTSGKCLGAAILPGEINGVEMKGRAIYSGWVKFSSMNGEAEIIKNASMPRL